MYDSELFLYYLESQAWSFPHLLPPALTFAAAVVGLRRTRHWSFAVMLCGVVLIFLGDAGLSFFYARLYVSLSLSFPWSFGPASAYDPGIFDGVWSILTGVKWLGAVTVVVGLFGLMTSRMLPRAATTGGACRASR